MYNYNPQGYQQQAYGGGYPQQQQQYNPMQSLGSIPPAAIPPMGGQMGAPQMGGMQSQYNPMGGQMGMGGMGGMPGGQMGGQMGMGGMPGGQMGSMGAPQGQNNAWVKKIFIFFTIFFLI